MNNVGDDKIRKNLHCPKENNRSRPRTRRKGDRGRVGGRARVGVGELESDGDGLSCPDDDAPIATLLHLDWQELAECCQRIVQTVWG